MDNDILRGLIEEMGRHNEAEFMDIRAVAPAGVGRAAQVDGVEAASASSSLPAITARTRSQRLGWRAVGLGPGPP